MNQHGNILSEESEEKAERTSQYLEILADFGRMAPECISIGQVLQLSTIQAVRGIAVRRAKVMRYLPDKGELLIVAGVGWNPGVVGHATLGADIASPPGRALRTRQPVLIKDLRNDRDMRYSPLLREHGVISSLNAPIAVDGGVWGVLEVDMDSEKTWLFGHDDTQFLAALACVLGIEIKARKAVAEGASTLAASTLAQAQQQTLMRELMHRDKNDFQTIMSMLILQAAKQTDEEVRGSFHHVIDGVTTISVAREQLSALENKGQIDLSKYLQALCGNLEHRRANLSIEADLDPVEIPHERAVPLGLITNELVTNAIKHAFPEGRPGKIRVTFHVHDNSEGYLSVTDNGVGMGPPRPGSSGTDLVKALARQIGGHAEPVPVKKGVSIAIRFPLVT